MMGLKQLMRIVAPMVMLILTVGLGWSQQKKPNILVIIANDLPRRPDGSDPATFALGHGHDVLQLVCDSR